MYVMYADDTTLLTSSSDPLTLETDLKRSLDMVSNWFDSNQLTLNIKKTKLMMFGSWQAFSYFKGSRIGHSVKASLWCVTLSINTRFRFFYFRISNC